jgi:hypothetical protein
MSKQKELRKRRAHPTAPPVDGLTVGWMTTFITALVCEIGAGALRLYLRFVDAGSGPIRMFSGLLLFAAAVIGIALLILTPVVVSRRRSHPPRGLVVFAYVVGALPWFAMFLQGQE